MSSPTTASGKKRVCCKTLVLQQPKAPLVKGGCLGNAEAGGFYGVAGFHIGLYFEKVPAVESLSHGEGHRGLPGRASSL